MLPFVRSLAQSQASFTTIGGKVAASTQLITLTKYRSSSRGNTRQSQSSYSECGQINMHDISIGNIRDWWHINSKSIIQSFHFSYALALLHLKPSAQDWSFFILTLFWLVSMLMLNPYYLPFGCASVNVVLSLYAISIVRQSLRTWFNPVQRAHYFVVNVPVTFFNIKAFELYYCTHSNAIDLFSILN